MRKLITSVLFLLAIAIQAQQISSDEAAAIASDFLNSSSLQLAKAKRIGVKRARAASNVGDNSSCPYYVFNGEGDQGFVIVSGDKRAKKILGYSDTGNFDFDNLPPQLEAMLDQYAEQITSLPTSAATDPSWSASARTSTDNGEVLLETAEWNQFMPYNAFCPEFDGIKMPTGCVNTAQAILMKYHEWPIQGNGSVSYIWEGKFLECNLSESTYDWAKMKNQYNDNEQDLTVEEINPIATLFRDVCFANATNFNFAGSGANYNISALVHNFSYAPKYRYFSRRCMTNDKLFSAIKKEIDSGRPCLVVSATTPAGLGGHAYVCDGYDANKYLHFNFGWGGGSNGYYSLEPVNDFPSYDIEFYGGLEPNRGNISEEDCLVLSAYSDDDFTFDGEYIHCNLTVRGGFFNRIVTIGIAFKNISDNSIIITEIDSRDWTMDNTIASINVDWLKHSTVIEDGDYIIYPTVKMEGKDWQEFDFNEYYQTQICLTVENGVWNLKNISNPGPLDEGKIEIDNVYYILNHDTHCATVTNRNSKSNSYSGDVKIPQSFEFGGEFYTVTRIGDRAMSGCTIDRLELPKTIETIESGGLLGTIHWINLSELTSLKTIEGWGIWSDMPDISLPENLEEIGPQAITFINAHFLNLPASLKSIGHMAFWGCTKLENIQFNCDNQETIEFIGGYEMLKDVPLRNMYVPEGSKALYESHFDFGNYHIREGQYQDVPGIDRSILINDINYIFIPETKTAKITYSSYDEEPKHLLDVTIPSSIQFENQQYTVREIDEGGFSRYTIDKLKLPRTIERIGKRAICAVNKINIEELSNLTVIEDVGFGMSLRMPYRLLLPSNLRIIGEDAFCGCAIQRVFLPRNLRHIGPRAFEYNNLLEAVHTFWTTAEEIQDVCSPDAFEHCEKLNAIIVPTGCKDIYKATEPWGNYPIFDTYLSFDTENSYIEMHAGEQLKLPIICSDKSVDCNNLIWETNNDCVQIDQDGNIKAIYNGECDITVRLENESVFPAKCHIYVVFDIIEEITLEPALWVGNVGDEFNIYARIMPLNASCTDLIWSSSDESVAIVNQGHVTLLSEGNCVITASAVDGSGLSASCEVMVKPIPAKSLVVSPENWNGIVGKIFQIIATVLPDNATNRNVQWSSSDESVATVDAHGNVTTHAVGKAVITVNVADGSSIEAFCYVTVNPILIESLTVNPASWNGPVGDSFILSATMLPDNATNRTVRWSSSDESIATVDETGNVTTHAVGKAVITASTADGSGLSASCEVTVNPILIESLAVTPESWNGSVGGSFTLSATMLPDNATNRTVRWSSSDEGIATVDETGNVTTHAVGKAVITASTADGSGLSASCEVTVNPILVESLTVNPASWNGSVGDSFTLSATMLPDNATNRTVRWSSSDESVAMVDEIGNVSTYAVGKAVITASTTDGSGLSASCEVTVNPILIESLAVTPESWNGSVGETFQITAAVTPENATDKTLVWSTSDETVAIVNDAGVVSVLKVGSCVITVSTVDGSNLTAECIITGTVGIDSMFADDVKVDVYNVNGVLLKRGCGKAELKSLAPGVYIVRSNYGTKTIVIY